MFPLRTGIVVVRDSGLKSIYDLKKYKGKRITAKYTSLSIIVDLSPRRLPMAR